MGNVVNKTFSLPRALAAKMDEFQGQVNWSEIARNAFERFLQVQFTERKRIAMIERLRETSEKAGAEARKNGRAQGAQWAEEHAKFSQLLALEELKVGQFGVDQIKGWPNWTTAEWVALQANEIPNDRDAQHEALRPSFGVSIADDFWDSVLGDEAEALTKSQDFVVGFVEGALEAWNEVKNEV